MIRLAIRTLPVFAVIIGFAMILAAFHNFSGVRTAYLDLIRSRMAMTAGSIANDIATANSLGIRLTEQTTLPDLLARQSSGDPLLLSIDVADSEGGILFSSDPASATRSRATVARFATARTSPTISARPSARSWCASTRRRSTPPWTGCASTS